MDNQPPINSQPSTYVIPDSPNKLAQASMVLGIVAVLTAVSGTVYLPFLFGGVGIILAILSKGYSNTLPTKALVGIIACIASLILNFFILGSTLYLVFNVPEYQQQFNQIYEQFYGESLDDTLERITGEDSDLFN